MNFIEAIRQLKKGKEVRRKGWYNEHCILSNETLISGENAIGIGSHYSRIKSPYIMDFDDILATDWELYE